MTPLVFFFSLYLQNRMEQVIKINCFASQRMITKQKLSTLSPILSQQDIRSLSLPTWMNSFNLDIDVLHSCFYYVVAAEKDTQQSRLLSFRQKCLANITQYYVRHRMTFQLYQYAYLCAKILAIPIDRTMHIIYFLVYARMASKPFISNQIKTFERNTRKGKRQNTTKSRYTHSVRSKENKSRHFTLFCESSQCEVEALKKELRTILKPEQSISKKIVKKGDSKKFLNFKKAIRNQPNHHLRQAQKIKNAFSCRSSITRNEQMIPIKVSNYQNSSIIKRFGMKPRTINSNSFKKIMFRRLNVNQCASYQFYDGKETKNIQMQRSNITKERNIEKVKQLKYFENIKNEIKRQNQKLDKVRQQSSIDNYFLSNPPSQSFQSPFSSTLRNTQFFHINSIPYTNSHQTLRQSQNIAHNNESINYINTQTDKYISITRKNENICLHDNLQQRKKITKMNRAHRYKQQYRHFLQTSLIKNPRDTA